MTAPAEDRVPLGMIHGRFQPFHLGHREYLHLALDRSEELIVGITNPDPWQIAEEAASSHRHREDANPFTFFERLRMVRAVLLDDGIPLERVYIIPFPVNLPERWDSYVPDGAVHFVRVFSEWEQTKVDRLREHGYRAEILTPGIEKEIEATEVRRRLAAGGDWRALVPPGTARVIEVIEAQRAAAGAR
ncbi:MAG: adenylyltransferase/cytidyltransferase family protein [Dehalococcoidia bacterium]